MPSQELLVSHSMPSILVIQRFYCYLSVSGSTTYSKYMALGVPIATGAESEPHEKVGKFWRDWDLVQVSFQSRT